MNWDRINLIPSVDDAWSYFKNTFSLIIDKHAPLKRFRTKNRYSPWFTHDLAALIQLKNALWRRARSSQSPADWLAFRQCRNKTTQAIRKAKINHFKEKFSACGTDAKKFWKTVKSMENKLASPHLPTSMKFGEIVVNDKPRMATLFNHHFVKSSHVFDAAAPNTASTHTPTSSSSVNSFSLQPVMVSEVLDELIKLDPNKSAGSDGLDPVFLKAAAHIIAAPITSLFNLSFQLSVFPLDWKSAMILPLFKGGSGSHPNCYRPISILPCLAKVIEKLVHKQLIHFIDSNHILSDLQSGFRTGHGCITATLKVLDDIVTAMATSKSV